MATDARGPVYICFFAHVPRCVRVYMFAYTSQRRAAQMPFTFKISLLLLLPRLMTCAFHTVGKILHTLQLQLLEKLSFNEWGPFCKDIYSWQCFDVEPHNNRLVVVYKFLRLSIARPYYHHHHQATRPSENDVRATREQQKLSLLFFVSDKNSILNIHFI